MPPNAEPAEPISDTSLPESQPGVARLDFEPDRVVVVSDLHLGVGAERTTGRYRPGENFLADSPFRHFLEGFEEELPAGKVVLVLNGDTFDFLRVALVPEYDHEFVDWQKSLRGLGVEKSLDELRRLHRREEAYGLRTEDYKCVWKLDRIAEGHPVFFAALGRWVTKGGWVVVVKGNHDVELFWPLVHRAIRREVARASDPAAAERVLFVQAGLRIGNVYLEHGHQYESTTAVKGPPVLPGDPPQLSLPLGSFVNRYLINPLEELEPFLDNIKPVERTIGAVLRRHPLRVFGILWRSLPFLRRAARPYWLREWLAFALFFGSLLIPVVTIAIVLAAVIWPGIVAAIPERLRPILSVAGLAAPWLGGILRDLMLRKSPYVGEDKFAAGLYDQLARVSFEAAHERIYGILGHTHEPDVQELPPLFGTRVLYLNTGTWIPLWQEDRPDLTGRVIYSVVSLVRDEGGSYVHTYLEWRPDAGRVVDAVLLGPRGRPRAGGFLSKREMATVRAFADVFIEGKEEILTPEEVAANVDAHLARVRTKRTTSLRLGFFIVEYLIPLLDGKWRFSRQPAAVRRRMIDRRLARDPGGALFRNIAKIKTLFSVGYYGCDKVFDSIGFVPVQQRPRNRPPNPPLRPIDPKPPLELEAPPHGLRTIDADLCVIGSGAGGAVVAALAAQAGRRVVLIEEGRYFPTTLLSHQEPIMSATLYKESGLQSTVDLGMTILQGRTLGGTTTINNHICFRLGDPLLTPGAPNPLDRWRSELRVTLDPAQLDRSYDRVLAAIGAVPMPTAVVGTNGEILIDGWKALVSQGGGDPGFATGRFTKNYGSVPGRECRGCGYCNFGCPYGRKLSMLETYVTTAIRHGAVTLTECHAERIVRSGRRVTGVECRLADGREILVRAGQVVVAAGAIGSTVLLLKSGFRDRPVGRRFSFNAASPVFAHFPDPLDGYDGDQMSTYIDTGDVLLESSFNPPMAFAVALPGWFATHFDRMRDFTRFACSGSVIATEPSGRVKRSAFTRTMFGPVDWRIGPSELDRLRSGISLLAQIFFAAGADYVLPATMGDHPMPASRFAPSGRPDVAAIDRFLAEDLHDPGLMTLNSSHPQGGNPMSDDPTIGAVDSRFTVHGTDNLYVTDASVFPTSIRINPQLTIMAFADYAWHHSISTGGR